jgi:hypothetical protein
MTGQVAAAVAALFKVAHFQYQMAQVLVLQLAPVVLADNPVSLAQAAVIQYLETLLP